jgi:hypothetical protein
MAIKNNKMNHPVACMKSPLLNEIETLKSCGLAGNELTLDFIAGYTAGMEESNPEAGTLRTTLHVNAERKAFSIVLRDTIMLLDTPSSSGLILFCTMTACS